MAPSLLLALLLAAGVARATALDDAPTHVGAAQCKSCHEAQYKAWSGSHHDLAMAEATEQSVLGDKHTRKHMREIFMPQFMDRRPYSEWETKRDDARDLAVNKARMTLNEHQPDMLDEKLSQELDRIIKSVEK